jgi:hypothetical protein
MGNKTRMEERPRNAKRKASNVEESKDREGEVPSPRKVKSHKIIEDSEGEEWVRGREEWVKRDPVTGKSAEEARVSSPGEAEVEGTEEKKDKGKRNTKRVRKLDRLEVMRELVLAVRELGSKVDMFADEVRNRVDREYLEEWRQGYFLDRMRNARDLGEDSEEYSE